MQTPIDQMEAMVEIGGSTLFSYVQQVMDSLGNRPFMSSRMTERQELEAYNALRLTQDGLYHYADGIRAELDSRLSDYTAEDRLALGLGDSEIRHIAFNLTLKYAARMNKLSAKLGIPIEGLELVPEPLPPEEIQLGGEEWQDSMTSLQPLETQLGQNPQSPLPQPPPQSPTQPPAEPSLPNQIPF